MTYSVQRGLAGFVIIQAGVPVDDEAMARRIERLLNEEEHYLAQEPPPEAGWIHSLSD